MAFDFRNELFAKIQRLSFTYHDQNRTGQLMVRATDDVEKLRLFLGQGLLIALQAVILLTGALIMMLLTNFRLTLVILPILADCVDDVHGLRRGQPTLVRQGAETAFRPEYDPAGDRGGHQGREGLRAGAKAGG